MAKPRPRLVLSRTANPNPTRHAVYVEDSQRWTASLNVEEELTLELPLQMRSRKLAKKVTTIVHLGKVLRVPSDVS
jgi:hypothetical protein